MTPRDHVLKVRRLRALYATVVGDRSPAAARVAMAGAATLVLAACPTPTGSKDIFAAAEKNPFGFQPIAVLTVQQAPLAPAFVDVNGDGAIDLFAGAGGESSGQIAYFANNGSRSSPVFAAPAGFSSLPTGGANSVPTPAFASLRGGTPDVLIGHWNPGSTTAALEYFKHNSGTGNYDAASVATDLPGLPTGANFETIAALADLDGDGLVDVVIDSSDGTTNTIDFFKNTGTSSVPAFTDQGTNLGLVLPAGHFGFPTFVDIDGDGDYDAFVGNDAGDIYFFENTGTRTAPHFAAPQKNPDGIKVVPNGPAIPAFVDIDGDGDFDLFVGDGNGDIWFYRNTNL